MYNEPFNLLQITTWKHILSYYFYGFSRNAKYSRRYLLYSEEGDL